MADLIPGSPAFQRGLSVGGPIGEKAHEVSRGRHFDVDVDEAGVREALGQLGGREDAVRRPVDAVDKSCKPSIGQIVSKEHPARTQDPRRLNQRLAPLDDVVEHQIAPWHCRYRRR
jgi:hypothetical protein